MPFFYKSVKNQGDDNISMHSMIKDSCIQDQKFTWQE